MYVPRARAAVFSSERLLRSTFRLRALGFSCGALRGSVSLSQFPRGPVSEGRAHGRAHACRGSPTPRRTAQEYRRRTTAKRRDDTPFDHVQERIDHADHADRAGRVGDEDVVNVHPSGNQLQQHAAITCTPSQSIRMGIEATHGRASRTAHGRYLKGAATVRHRFMLAVFTSANANPLRVLGMPLGVYVPVPRKRRVALQLRADLGTGTGVTCAQIEVTVVRTAAPPRKRYIGVSTFLTRFRVTGSAPNPSYPKGTPTAFM